MKEILKSEKGIVGADIAIALSILMLFAIIIAALYLNTNNNAMSIQRTAKATEIITNIFEKIDLMYYDEVVETGNTWIDLNNDTSNRYNELKEIINNTKGYNVRIKVEQYREDENSADLVKKITANVVYKVGKKNEEITMNKVKTRENIIVPNKPTLPTGNNGLVPIKQLENGTWIQTYENDTNWYNYEMKHYAYAVKINEAEFQSIGNIKELKNDADKYIWVPAFGKSGNEYKYLYGTTGKTTYRESGENFVVTKISPESVNIDSRFDNKTGIWEKESDFKARYVNGTVETDETILQKCR